MKPDSLKKILLAVDGEPHTRRAIDYTLTVSSALGAEVTAFHVLDPYLKQFYTEIYAQGRKEYLAHVESELQKLCQAALTEVEEIARKWQLSITPLFRHGEPLEEIVREAHGGGYDLVVVGGKSLTLKNRLRSRNLPEKILKKVSIPLLVVRESRG